MNDIIEIKICSVKGEITECMAEVSQVPPWTIRLSGLPVAKTEFSGDDLFNALIALRIELEKSEMQLLCNGARKDVFPSAMSRQMSGARKAYITRLNQPALQTDIVDIFCYAPPELVGSVRDQKSFHEKWIQSLRI